MIGSALRWWFTSWGSALNMLPKSLMLSPSSANSDPRRRICSATCSSIGAFIIDHLVSLAPRQIRPPSPRRLPRVATVLPRACDTWTFSDPARPNVGGYARRVTPHCILFVGSGHQHYGVVSNEPTKGLLHTRMTAPAAMSSTYAVNAGAGGAGESSAAVQTRPLAIDLFSGCGGLTLGLRLAGFDVTGALDVDGLATETYSANHPHVMVWLADIRDISSAELMEKLRLVPGDLDLLAGCPPCQGFSTMRTHNRGIAVDDPRNDLVLEFVRFARELRPKAIMMENVPGLATDGRIRSVVKQLEQLGYSPRVQVHDAASFGVPQRRRRMILLAGRFGPIGFAKPDALRHTVRETIQSLPQAGRSGDPLHDLAERRSTRILELIKAVAKDGGGRADLGADQQLACHTRCAGFRDVYGRMSWDNVAPTITSGYVNPSKGRFLHPEEDRSITLREAAMLQSFPSDYFISLRRGKMKAAATIGNALPPEFIRRHTLRIIEYLAANVRSRPNASR